MTNYCVVGNISMHISVDNVKSNDQIVYFHKDLAIIIVLISKLNYNDILIAHIGMVALRLKV